MLKYFFSAVSIIASLMFSTLSMADHSHDYAEATKAYNAGDYQKALHLWTDEAEKGNLDAQEMLGAMYASGKGTQKDNVVAAKWYRMAAEQGQTSAQYRLGAIYYEGLGVQKSLEHAYAWWLVSAANGNKGAKDKQRIVLNEMAPEQIETSKQIVVEILQRLAE